MSNPGFGRGRLFPETPNETTNPTLNVTDSSGENKTVRESGYETKSGPTSSGILRGRRGKVIEELRQDPTSLDTNNRGRGRAFLLETLRSSCVTTPTQTTVLPVTVIRAPRGRGLPTSSKATPPSVSPPDTDQLAQAVSQLQVSAQDRGDIGDGEQAIRPALREAIVMRGHKGKDVPVVCNYILLRQSDSNKGVYEYDVRFSPKIDSRKIRFDLLNEHSSEFGGVKTFDGATLFLPIQLPQQENIFMSKNPADESDIEIHITYKCRKDLKDCVNLYNILFDRIMHTLDYVRFNRKQFDPSIPITIPQHKLEVWPGYVTSVDEYESGLMLCCDVSHRVLCQTTVLDKIRDAYKQNPRTFQEVSKKAVLGCVVITRYNNKTYRVDDIAFDVNPMSTFTTNKGEVTYYDYYRTQHNIEIQDLQQPLLVSIQKKKIFKADQAMEVTFCLIPELCNLTGLRDEMRTDYNVMRSIATSTRVSPNQRALALEKFCANVNGDARARKILEDWGLQLSNTPQELTARQFDTEQITLGRRTVNLEKYDFGNIATTNELISVVHLDKWLLIYCRWDEPASRELISRMKENSAPMGIKVAHPTQTVVLENDRIESVTRALRENIRKDYKIVVCICPSNRDDRYAAIKKVCCVEAPIPSQVINSRTLQNKSKNRAIVQKILLQMNCKLGGSLWSINIPLKSVMFCGIDTYHDPSNKRNSVSAFVASLNPKHTRWYSQAIMQDDRDEIVAGICESLVKALKAYNDENNSLPDKIIVFRDGVGYGQLTAVKDYEITQFMGACLTAFPNYLAKITFVVVQKRINTRIMASHNPNELVNPLPGTVLDHTVTQRYLYDFFLISQKVNEGTVTPTHYIVLRDDSKFEPDILQRMSYKMCYMYYNWPGPVRVPACCQYAHKLAYLIGQSVRRPNDERLNNKLFYL